MLHLFHTVLLVGFSTVAVPNERSGTRQENSVVHVGGTYIAETTLSFSNVRLAIEETLTNLAPLRSNRVLTLTSPAGQQRRIPLSSLSNGGGGMNLYALQDGYILLGENDCIALNDITLETRSCLSRETETGVDQRCEAHRQPDGVLGQTSNGHWPIYLGRFDWMNGYDPPDGRFSYALRYQTLESALESLPDCS
ncbi:MAG: hypothetical protein KF780_09450 [Sphingomonas sp.]|nr:hypothetical protein [Sphingomonas sp.]